MFQGPPISGLNLVVEVIAVEIRGADKVKGIRINDTEVKLNKYADDAALFLRDPSFVNSAMELLNDFKNVSGWEVNVKKCNLIWKFNVQFN